MSSWYMNSCCHSLMTSATGLQKHKTSVNLQSPLGDMSSCVSALLMMDDAQCLKPGAVLVVVILQAENIWCVLTVLWTWTVARWSAWKLVHMMVTLVCPGEPMDVLLMFMFTRNKTGSWTEEKNWLFTGCLLVDVVRSAEGSSRLRTRLLLSRSGRFVNYGANFFSPWIIEKFSWGSDRNVICPPLPLLFPSRLCAVIKTQDGGMSV